MNRSATRVLRDEHAVILAMLERFEHELDSATAAAGPGRQRLTAFIDFFRGYADDCHHRKEEIGLFPLLERHQLETAIACMLDEHRAGRALLAQLEQAIEVGDTAAFVAAGAGYIDLLRAHIEKENCMLFEMADECLTADEVTELLRLYTEFESEPAYVAMLERCRRLGDALREPA